MAAEQLDSEASLRHYELGRSLMAAGQFEQAVEAFRASVDVHPHFKALELLGECLMHLGRHREAIVPLAAATSLNRGVRAPSLLAEAMVAINYLSDARDLCQLALARDPNNRKAKEILSKLVVTEDGFIRLSSCRPSPEG